MSEDLFTLDQANALIPQLEIVMGKLLQRRAALSDGVAELALSTGADPSTFTVSQILELRPQLRPLMEEVQQLIEVVEDLGGQLKGLDLGLVDFPSELNGELVLLCWQFGEKEIAHYHSLDGGFAGRRPLELGHKRPQYLN